MNTGSNIEYFFNFYKNLASQYWMSRRDSRQFDPLFKTKTTITKEKKTALLNILKGLFINQYSEQFRQPLDWKERGLINYDLIIQQPMDLSTVRQTLNKQMYSSVEDCLNDIQLIFQNSKLYNKGTAWIQDLTNKCEKAFLKLVRNYLPEMRAFLDSQSKKSLKAKKIKSKHKDSNSNEKIQTNHNQDQDQQRPKLQQHMQQTAVPEGEERKMNKQIETEETIQFRNQFFEIIKDSSQRSLQIAYLIIKSEDLTVITTDRNGNCSIDVKKLPHSLIVKLIEFLKDQKAREDYETLKAQSAKRKRLSLDQKNRYQI